MSGTEERRAPVQGDGFWHLPKGHPARSADAHPPGTVAWPEHVEAWKEYGRRYRNRQSAERLAERGGFGFSELCDLLGRDPQTWEAR